MLSVVSCLNEEDYDRMKDRRMERGGVDGNNRYPSKSSSGGSQKKYDPKKAAETRKRNQAKNAKEKIIKGLIDMGMSEKEAQENYKKIQSKK